MHELYVKSNKHNNKTGWLFKFHYNARFFKNALEEIRNLLCTRESISRLAPSCGESKHFFALNIG